ncbi:MAG: GMC family oxidoreductase [Acidobacteriota bacterium]|nr:GMC family oxidoreductase [Acidobacteriota bacterium]
MSERYDVIVIGTGAGGGTLAHRLATTGKRILILERGDFLPREKENWSPVAVWGDRRYHNSGKWLDGDGREFSPKQHYYVGGNTKFYGAVLFRMRERDFSKVHHVDGVSEAWPISYADLEPYYTAAEQLYQVHGLRGADPTEPPASAPYPHPPISNEARIDQLSEDLLASGLHPFPLPNGILIDESDPAHSPCIRCETCDGFPCLLGAKADSHVVCVEPALRHSNVSLLTNARVVRLDTSPDGREVTGVVVERGGQTEVYQADIVALAAGAINSAAILLASANDRHPDGLANRSGVVGRNLMLHLNSSLIAFSRSPNPTRFQKTLGVNDYYWGDGDWPFPLGHMQMLGRSDAFTMSLDAPEADDPADLARHSLDFWLTTEDLARWGNRVVPRPDGTVQVHYKPTNVEAHDRLTERFKALLSTMRCHDNVIYRSEYVGGRLGISGVAHQNGTIRFGHDPASSALDVDCKAHDLENLYVADASFFVSASAVNPTLTIIANALRVGDRISEHLGVAVPR